VRELLTQLCRRQPEINISDEDLMCVQIIMGLCHVLGHEPSSHVFDVEFISRTRPDLFGEKESTHELTSNLTFFSSPRTTSSELPYQGKSFTTEMIFGAKDSLWMNCGVDKYLLYDTVSNTISGLDVGKLDYFTRDSTYLTASNSSSSVCLLARMLLMQDLLIPHKFLLLFFKCVLRT
jgi:HD superfamily phosphohydrolase